MRAHEDARLLRTRRRRGAHLFDDALPEPPHHQGRRFHVLHGGVQPLRDRVTAGDLDAVEAVDLHHPAGSMAVAAGVVLVGERGHEREGGGDVELARAIGADAVDLEVVERGRDARFLDRRSLDAVAGHRLHHALVHADRRLLGARRRGVEELDDHPLLDALGEVLTLAVRLPASRRRERGVGDVALRLAVADEPHVDRAGQPPPERLRVLDLARSHRLPGERLGPVRGRLAGQLVEPGPLDRALARPGEEARHVVVHKIGGRGGRRRRPPLLVARQVRRCIIARRRKLRTHVNLIKNEFSRTTRRRGSRSRRARARAGPRST